MPEFKIKAPDGQEFRVTGPEGATEQQALEQVMAQWKPRDQTTRTERFGMGLADPFYGAAQFGARMEEEGGLIPSTVLNPKAREERIAAVDKTVREREEAYEKRRGGAAHDIDWMRGLGAMPGTLALTAPLAVTPASPFVLGAGGGAVTPAKDFEREKLGQMGWGAAIGGPLGYLGKGLAAGVSAFGRYLAREYPSNILNQATRRILETFRQDQAGGGLTAREALEAVNAARDAGKPAMLVDYAGPNTRGLGGELTRKPGEARAVSRGALDERQMGAADRLEDDLARFVHGDQSMHQTIGGLRAARAGASAEPYRLGLDPQRVVDSPYIRQVLDDPVVRGGIREGLEAQRLEALGNRLPFEGADAAQSLVMDAAGNVTGVRGVPNMRVLDAVKKGMDRLIEKERDSITGRLSERGRHIDQVRRQLLADIDARNPDYAQARAIWSGYSASMDALNTGRAALRSMSPDEIAQEFARLSPGDQEFFRLGIATHMREVLLRAEQAEGIDGANARNLANKLLTSEWTRRQLRPIFRNEQDFNGFMQALNTEHRMFGTRAELRGGSPTGDRRAQDTSRAGEVMEQAVELGHNLLHRPFNLIGQAYRAWRQRASAQDLTANEAANSTMARILFGGRIDPASEEGRRLLGTFTGPAEQLPRGFAATATGLRGVSQALSAGGGAFAAGPLGP